MKFLSTHHQCPAVNAREAVLNGLAPDGGLYVPEAIPRLPDAFFHDASTCSFPDIAFQMAKLFFASDVPKQELRNIIDASFDFAVPIVSLEPNVHALELFHGPTCAFKDFAARFMAQLIGYFAEQSQREITILVATSGDTGSAVADGFAHIPGVRVVILYPKNRVSSLQEKQLACVRENVAALRVDGSFDDCQMLVKQAFSDETLRASLTLASANSINIARLIPQSFYDAFAVSRLLSRKLPIVFSVPCGNFGNLTAGLLLKKMGAPIHPFIAATNANDVVPEFLRTGTYRPRPSMATISNAMDVGNPSNFARMLHLYDSRLDLMRRDMIGMSFSDEETARAIEQVFERSGYVLDPHGAVAYLGLKQYQSTHAPCTGVFLETAHPAKFSETVEPIIGQTIPLPPQLASYLDRPIRVIDLENRFEDLKTFLLDQK